MRIYLFSLPFLSVVLMLGCISNHSSLLPSGFQKVEASERFRLKVGDQEHEVEVSEKFLDYDLNPTAMKRFTSAAVAQLRTPSRLEPSITPEKGYCATIATKDRKEDIWITLLLVGKARNFRTVTIESWGCSSEAHLSMVNRIRKTALRETGAEPDGPANGSQPIRSDTNQTPSAAGSRR